MSHFLNSDYNKLAMKIIKFIKISKNSRNYILEKCQHMYYFNAKINKDELSRYIISIVLVMWIRNRQKDNRENIIVP